MQLRRRRRTTIRWQRLSPRANLAESHPSLSLSTVYATIETFVKKDLIRRLHTGSGKSRVDGTVRDHDHALCRICGLVFDVGRDIVSRPDIPDRLPRGLTVTNVNITYEVECPDCRPAEGSTSPENRTTGNSGP